MSEKPENVRSLVSSLPKSLLFRILWCVFARTHVFVCLLCHCWPKLKPQECEITSTRGISRLCRAEKICFCQTTQSISIPNKLCFTSSYSQPTHFPYKAVQLNRIIIYKYIYMWVPTGIVCPGLLMLHPWPVLSLLSIVHGASFEKTNSPCFFFGGRHADRKSMPGFPWAPN